MARLTVTLLIGLPRALLTGTLLAGDRLPRTVLSVNRLPGNRLAGPLLRPVTGRAGAARVLLARLVTGVAGREGPGRELARRRAVRLLRVARLTLVRAGRLARSAAVLRVPVRADGLAGPVRVLLLLLVLPLLRARWRRGVPRLGELARRVLAGRHLRLAGARRERAGRRAERWRLLVLALVGRCTRGGNPGPR
ncbi:hypothetical protein [Hamadaea tsunoensis]|uniref:hypothetical protein n=1 Tax=Hamadaea tsunoensis TaxID=53368 RepID=UPI0012F96209|nr:hypothetical protein [Hamadaea tsunoensis]